MMGFSLASYVLVTHQPRSDTARQSLKQEGALSGSPLKRFLLAPYCCAASPLGQVGSYCTHCVFASIMRRGEAASMAWDIMSR